MEQCWDLRSIRKKIEWSLSEDKKNSLTSKIDLFLAKKLCNLNEIKKLHGKLLNFSQACVSMKGLRSNILTLIKKFNSGNPEEKLIPATTKRDLQI